MPKQIIFDGLKFNRDDKTGYYLCTSRVNEKRPRLHRYIWEYYNGKIPKGYQVHHKDFNKENNNIENLELLPKEIHLKVHAGTEEHKQKSREFLEKYALPKAIEWHKSEECREISRRNWVKSLGKAVQEKTIKVCEQCGIEYEVNMVNAKKSRFCSNKCKSKWRRNNHLDYESRKCLVCGNIFNTSKYGKRKTCSVECKSKLLIFTRNGIKRF